MIYTDRKYNKQKVASREECITRLERERDELTDQMFDNPSFCTEENINRLNYLSSQVEIMLGNKLIHY